jgi:spore germination cell wall hydrolase CwlJ-like protein
MSTPGAGPGRSTPTGSANAADVVRGLSEVDALALTIWGESRQETPDGQIAVGQVILHRLHSGHWGHRINDVVCARSQFSCHWVWGGRDNHARVLAMAQALDAGEAVQSESWRQCRWIAQGLLDGMVVRDLVRGSTNYLTADLLKSGLAPRWANEMEIRARVGAHVFGVAK